MKRFLKRFEKLENNPTDWSTGKEKLSGTRRFERLEVNDRRVEITISDRAAKEESAPPGTNYFRMCPYCGAENKADSAECCQCRHALSDFAADYGGKENLIKKCVCGAINLKDRKFCWVCGRDFSLWGDEKVVQKQQNLIIININGTNYRSDDPNLPPGIVALMEKIRRQGYSKELIDEWMRQSNDNQASRTEEIKEDISRLRMDIIWRIIVAALLLIIFIAFRVSYRVR